MNEFGLENGFLFQYKQGQQWKENVDKLHFLNLKNTTKKSKNTTFMMKI